MTTEPNTTGGPQKRLADVLAAYMQAIDTDDSSDLDQWLSRYPEFAGELTQYAINLQRIDQLLTPLRTAAGAASLEGCLGDYRILREIGRGGMGIVYEAEQISLRRRVALKVLPFAAVLDDRQRKRFQNEAQAAALLRHANIVGVHAVGCERGVHYYAMDLVEGRSLAEVVAQLRQREDNSADDQTAKGPDTETNHRAFQTSFSASDTAPVAALSTERSSRGGEFYRSAARLGVQAAEALDYAHQEGVVHRDIKPSNLLLDENGKLWITDFGLAHVQGDPGLTMTGDVLGTLRYMSPEQASGERSLVDRRTDIYSLGVTLYELLTLRPAFGGGDRQKLLREIGELEPSAPRKINSAIPKDLETIVLKAITKEPRSRYGTAREVAEDLQRFLEDRPIRARRPSLADRARKWARRHRPIVWSAVAALIMAVVTLSVSVLLIARAYDKADTNYRLARDAVDSLLDRLEGNIAEAAREHALDRLSGYVEYAVELDKKLPEEVRNSRRHRARLASMYYQRGRCARWWLAKHETAETSLRAAIAIYDKLADEFPDQYHLELALCHYYLANSLQEKQQPEDADRYFRLCLQLFENAGIQPGDSGVTPPDMVEPMIRADEAFDFIEERRLEQSIAKLDQAIRRDPEDPNNYQQLGDLYKEKGELDQAVSNYKKAIQLSPRTFELYLPLLDVYLRKGEIDNVVKTCNEAIEHDPTSEMAHSWRGFAYLLKGDLENALTCLNEVIQINPREPKNYTFRGYVYRSRGDLDRAIEDFTTAFALSPEYVDPLAFRGEAYREAGDLELAIADYDLAIRRDPSCDMAYCYRALVRARLDQLADALYDIEKASEIDIQECRGRVDVAIRLHHVAWFLATCPDSRLRRPARAVHLARQALEILPGPGFQFATVGVAQYREGSYRAARKALERSAELASYRQTAGLFFLAMTYWQLEEREAALRTYNEAVEQMEQDRPYQEREHTQLRDEAAELLGVRQTPPAAKERPTDLSNTNN